MAYCWYFTQDDLEHKTPSREDGIPSSVEARYRKDGSRFIINASNTLGLRQDTLATGVVYFHRFFMMQSFKQFDRWVVGAACLLLAGKVEETPKKCKDIIKVTGSLLNEQQMRGFGNNPKEELLTHERILLQTIKFDLQLQHPYTYLLKYAKALKGDKSKIEKLVQMAWTFVNDSFSTTLCLHWEPQAIAVAFLYLAGKLTKFDLQGMVQSKSRSWWRQFVDTLDIHDLESICHQVLDLYGESGSTNNNQEQEPAAPPVSDQAAPPTLAVPGRSIPPMQPQQQVPTVQQNQSLLGQPPMSVPPTNHIAPPISVTSLMGTPPTTLSQSQATFFNPMGLSFMANPLQALQSLRPTTNQQSAASAVPYSNQQYSSLSGVPGATNTPQQPQPQQQVGGYGLTAGVGGQAVPGGGVGGKTFQPTTPVGLRGNPLATQQLTPQQLTAQKLIQPLTPQQLATQQITPHQMTPQQMVSRQLTPQQMLNQSLTPQQLAPQQLSAQQMTPRQLTPQQLATQQLSAQQMTPQQLATQQLSAQRMTPRQVTPQQLMNQQYSTQQMPPQQLSAPRMAQQQQQLLNIQQQSMLVQNTVGGGTATHSLPHTGTYSPAIRNMGTGLVSSLPRQPQQTTPVAAVYTTLPLAGHQQRLTTPHMMQSLANPQQQQLVGSTQTQPQLPQALLGVCTASSIPTQAPPIFSQHHNLVSMPTGLGGAPRAPMNIGMTRVPPQQPQMATPTRPMTTPTRPPGGQPYNMGGVGRGWGLR